jgi:hypothetical protein
MSKPLQYDRALKSSVIATPVRRMLLVVGTGTTAAKRLTNLA